MRVLFTAAGAYSHVLPMVGMAQALADAGHEVVVATAGEVCSDVEGLGLATAAAGMSSEAMVTEARARWPATAYEPPATWALRMFAEIAAPTMLADLVAVVVALRPDVIVREEGEFAGPVAAAAARVPWVTHGWGSPIQPPGEREALAAWIAPLWRRAALEPPSAGGLNGTMVLDPCPASLYQNALVVGTRQPVRPTTPPATDEPSITWPDSGRPLAYLGFGTVPLYRDAPELMTAAVESLLSAGYDAVVTSSDPRLARQLSERAPDRVQVERWVSLPALFERCDLVVCHGGAGTVLTALGAAVPLLLLPRGAPSQLRMSSACRARGVARVVEAHETTERNLREALAAIAHDERYRSAAHEVATEIAAMPSAAEVVHRLQSYSGTP
ncbi:MAG: jadS [Acidimicrobiales bacterium]|nr:jadS [Acidimicrobiales bacterium]